MLNECHVSFLLNDSCLHTHTTRNIEVISREISSLLSLRRRRRRRFECLLRRCQRHRIPSICLLLSILQHRGQFLLLFTWMHFGDFYEFYALLFREKMKKEAERERKRNSNFSQARQGSLSTLGLIERNMSRSSMEINRYSSRRTKSTSIEEI